MAEVFISYAREDKEFVQRLCHALKQKNRDTWIDLEGIRPSVEWRTETLQAMEAADTVVLVITPHFAASKTCADELAHALNCAKRIIPILRQEVDESALPNDVSGRQWIFITEVDDFEAGVDSLVSTLDTDLEWVRAHTRLLTRSIEWEKHKRDYGFALHGSDLRRAEALLTSKDQHEPGFLPLQVEYIISSRRTSNKRFAVASGAGAVALLAVLIFGLLFWQKRQESTFNLAANFREMGISELAGKNPLAAEVLFARALSLTDNLGAHERLLEARAKSPRLLWISPTMEDAALLGVSSDGSLFAVATPLDLSIWSSASRKKLRTIHANYQDTRLIAFAPDSTFFVVGSSSKIELWDVKSSSEHPSKVIVPDYEVSSLSVSPDGSALIVGGGNGNISVWNIREQVSHPFKHFDAHSDRITATALSSDGASLVSASWDETALVWNWDGASNTQKFSGHDDALLCVAVSSQGDLVASAGWDDTIWIWNRKTGNPVRALTGHKGSILSLAFSPDGKSLVSGSEDRTARLWDVERGVHLLTFEGHSGEVTSVAFVNSKDNKNVVTGDATGHIRIWDIGSIGERDELTTLRGHDGAVTMVAFSPTAPILASSSVDKSVLIWDLRTSRVIKTFKGYAGNVSSVSFSPDGRLLASANKSSELQIWNLQTGEPRALYDENSSAKIRHVVFSPDGLLLAGGSDDGKLRVWSTRDWKLLTTFVAHTAKIQGVAFNSKGTLLATSSEDSTVKLWRTDNWALERTLTGHRSGVYEIAFSPDGRLILTGSDDKTARFWDTGTGKEVIAPIAQVSPVWAVDISPDGKTIAVGTEDSQIQLWDLSGSSGVPKLLNHIVLQISDGPVWWMRFHDGPNGINLAVGGQDRIVRVLNLKRFRAIFSNPATLEQEAEQQGGLMIGQGSSGEPQIVSLPWDRFTGAKPESDLRAASR